MSQHTPEPYWVESFHAPLKDLANKTLERSLTHSLRPPHAIDFSSNNTLGLAHHPEVVEAGYQSARQWGAGSTASRLVTQTNPQLLELEATVATITSWPGCVYLTSGFMANNAIMETLSRIPEAQFFIDHRAHASLFAAAKSTSNPVHIFRHGHIPFLKRKIMALPPSKAPIFIWIEALHSMDGTLAPTQEWETLCSETGAFLVVDEAHSFGIVGPQGGGWVASHPPLKKHTAVVMLGCGKALGVSGGCVVGPPTFLKALTHWGKPLIYSTGPSPFVVGALKKSVELATTAWGDTQRNILFQNAHHFLNLIKKYQLKNAFINPPSPIASFFCSPKESVDLAQHLFRQGFWVRPMRPPTVPNGTSRLRIVLQAQHTYSQIEKLITLIHRGTS